MGGWKQQTDRRHGFTLVEVLTAVVLVSVLIGLLLIPLGNSIGYFRTATARGDAQTVARNALEAMAREISEAAYVWQDMNDNTMIAFAPPLRVDPEDPNSEIVTPPRPDWSRAVRYWRALHNPTYNYSVGTTLAQPNPYFLARTVVEDPFKEDDEWNTGDLWWYNRNLAWAEAMNQEPDQANVNWAPLTRIVSMDVDRKRGGAVGARDSTLQPGYPYLEATWNHTDALPRFYRDRVVGLTPDAVDYDVPSLTFEPLVVSGEWLTPGPDKSTYLAHYPLWRLGVPYQSWTALQAGENPVFGSIAAPDWARDPFLVIYRYGPAAQRYAPVGIGCFDPRSRTMKVIDYHSGVVIYDTWQYPLRAQGTLLGFDVDWINGALRFDFPPYHAESGRTEDRPIEVAGSTLTAATAKDDVAVFDYPLVQEWWGTRSGGQALTYFLLPDRVTVRIDSNGDGQPDRALKRVYRTPRDYADEFQVGLNPAATGATGLAEPKYGCIRLPAHLADFDDTNSQNRKFWIYYRWRNNGIVPAGQGLEEEKPDLISAYYHTGAVIDISLTVTRANPSARAGQRVAQSAHMTRRVKLQHVIREVRDVR